MLPQLEILKRIKQVCQEDERVVAAMLFGSFALGEGDRYSDIDIVILIKDEAVESFGKRQWLERVAPVAMLIKHEYGFDVAVFDNLVRGEFQFERLSGLGQLVSLCRERTRFPSLESTIVFDRDGIMAQSIAELIGEPLPLGTSDQEAQDAVGRFVNWFLFGINLLRRGEYAHALDMNRLANHNLIRVARIVEGNTSRWSVPEKFLEHDLSTGAYERLASCTSALNPDSLWQAYSNSWNWALEMLSELANHHRVSIPVRIVEAVDSILSMQGISGSPPATL